MHTSTLEPRTDSDLAAGLDHAGGGAQSLLVKVMVAHAGSVGVEVVDALTRLVAAGGVRGQSKDDAVDVAGVEFVVALPSPLLGQFAIGAINGLGDIAQMLLGMESVHDLDGVGEVFSGQVPDPGGAIAQYDMARGALEAAADGFATDTPGELRGHGVGVVAGGALNGCGVGAAALIAYGDPRGVMWLGTPDSAQFNFAGLGRAIGLLAGTPGEGRGAHRN